MRTFLISILLCVFDLAFAANYPPSYFIPAGGQTISNLTYYQVANQTFYVSTNGSVNLGSNTYTLTYASLPAANTTWNVVVDLSNLTLNTTTNVNLFGETPLSTYYPIKKFYINFRVVFDASGTPVKKVVYCASLDDLKTISQATTFSGVTTFNARANFNDSVFLYGGKDWLKPTSAITTGQTVTALDTTGKLGYGCVPWCITGNSGLNSTTNFLGTTDTVPLRFRVNNQASGIIDYNLANTAFGYQANKSNTSGTSNTSLGYTSLFTNNTGSENTAIGLSAMYSNTTGSANTAVGKIALTSNTTGGNNTSIGTQSMNGNTTGSSNTSLGVSSLATNTTGSFNTALGTSADVATSSTTKAIALGYQATASSNQLAIAGIRSISIPQMTSSINYILTDTSGTGDFVPQPIPYLSQTTYTPLTGDSVSVSTSSNLINPAGTIANFTIRLPSSYYGGQLFEFSTTQTITTLHWSTALASDAYSVESHVPTTLSAGGTIKIMYNSATLKWCNW